MRQALQDLGVEVDNLNEIQLCKVPTWKEQITMRLERTEPDHQTMFLHFTSSTSKEQVKALLGGQWVAGISKPNNQKRDCAGGRIIFILLHEFYSIVISIWF